MTRKEKITAKLQEIGACWAVKAEKYHDPNDPSWMGNMTTWHIHPNEEYPHQDNIRRFETLQALEEWIEEAIEL